MHPVRVSSKEFNDRLSRNIGEAAREARKAASLTQEQAAERIGISPEFYARVERGAALPGLNTFYKIASVLEVSADALLGAFINAGDEATSGDGASPSPGMRRLIRRLRKMQPEGVAMIHRFLDDLERQAG